MPNQYVNKVNLADGTSIIDISDTTATADKILQGYGAYGKDGAWMDGTAVAGSGSAVTVVDTPDEHGGTIRTITAVSLAGDTVSAAHLETGYTAHDALGNPITGTLSPSGGTVNLQTKTNIDPTESSQTITADAGYDGLDSVQINGVSSSYVGSGVTRRSSSDLSASGATVSVPAGYYASNASKDVASGTAGTPSASKGTVSNHAVTVTPAVTNTAGYISGGTKTGTGVTVSASELVSGSQTITQNGTVDVTNLASVTVNVSGGGGTGMQISTATATPTSASASISFTGLQGEPTSFAVVSAADLATGASPYKTAAVVFDGETLHGAEITNTSNAQVTAATAFTKSYSNGTLTITGTGTNFQANEYVLVYTYGGSSANIGTADVQVGSGATSVTFTGLETEPDYFSCIFKSDFGTSSGYQRVIAVVYDGTDVYGLEMDSGAKFSDAHWSYAYNNGALTISSQGTNAGGYFHQPGYYQLTYGVGGEAPAITAEPLEVTTNGTYTAPKGKAYTPVTVNVSGGGGGKAVQVNSEAASVHTNAYSSTGISITVAKSGTYNVSWMAWRSSSSGTMGTNLYKNGTAGTNQQTWTNTYGQHIALTNQSYNAGDVLTLYANAGSTTRYCWAGNLIIEEQ